MKKIFYTSIILTTLVAHTAMAKDIYTFGIVPQQAASKLAKLWAPILKEVSNQSGVKLIFATAPSIPKFEEKLLQGKYDFSYMNPYHFITYNKENGYSAIAKQAGKRIKGVIVAHKESGIKNLSDLNGKEIAFPAPKAFAASLLPSAELKKQNINFIPKYVKSHDSVYQNIANKRFIAGGGIERTLSNTNPAAKEQLEVIWTTKGYTPHAIAAHSNIDPIIVQKVQNAFLSLNNSEKGKNLLKNIKFKGIEKAADNDWDDIRSLNLEN